MGKHHAPISSSPMSPAPLAGPCVCANPGALTCRPTPPTSIPCPAARAGCVPNMFPSSLYSVFTRTYPARSTAIAAAYAS
jgi:hypothetical protein